MLFELLCPDFLLYLYCIFSCYESVYILYDILVRVFVNTISDILSDIACSIFQNISTYYILSIKYKVFCICDTDFQPLGYYGFVSQPLQNSSVFFRVGISACLQTKYKTFVRVDFFKYNWKLQIQGNVLEQFTVKTWGNSTFVATCLSKQLDLIFLFNICT